MEICVEAMEATSRQRLVDYLDRHLGDPSPAP